MDASEIFSKRLNAKEVIFPKEGEFVFPITDGRIKNPRRRSGNWEHPPWYGIDQFKEKVTWIFLDNQKGSLPPPHDSCPHAGKANYDFWSMSWNIIYRHHVEPRVKLYSPREESLPVPLKYIDVSRTTHTNLDVKQEKRIDDYWNIDWSRDLSASWTGFTQFIPFEEKPPDGYLWVGWRLTRKQRTSSPDHLCPELWTKLGRNAQQKIQKWSHEKPKLDNTSRLRGIYFIDPEDKEFKETIKNARKKLGTPIALSLPCKMSKNSQNWVTRGKSNEIKSKFACILEASESTRLRMGNSIPHHHEDHIAGKGEIHYSTTSWFTNLFLCLKPWKFPQQRQQWTRNGKIGKDAGVDKLTKVRSKKEVIDEARTKGAKVHFVSLMDMSFEKMLNWRQSTKYTKVELYS